MATFRRDVASSSPSMSSSSSSSSSFSASSSASTSTDDGAAPPVVVARPTALRYFQTKRHRRWSQEVDEDELPLPPPTTTTTRNPAAATSVNVVRSPMNASGTSSSSESVGSESSSSQGSSSGSSSSSESRRESMGGRNIMVVPPRETPPAPVKSHSTELDWLSLLNRRGGTGYEGDKDDDNGDNDDETSTCSSLTSDGDTNWSSIFLQPTASVGSDGDAADGSARSVLSILASSRDGKGTEKSIDSTAFREKVVQFPRKGRDHSKLREVEHTLSEYREVHKTTTGLVLDDLRYGGDGPAAATSAGTGEYSHPPPSGSATCFVAFSSHPRDRVVIELFADQVPIGVRHFLDMLLLPVEGRRPALIVSRIVPNSYVQLGDTASDDRARRDDEQVASRDEPVFQHSEAGLLSVVDYRSNMGSASFIITARPMPQFDGRHMVVGRVVEGLESVVRSFTNNTAVDDRQRPMFERIRIVDCGMIVNGMDVRPEEPSPVELVEEVDLKESAEAIPSAVPSNHSIETADSTAKPAELPSTFSLESIKAAASSAVSCGAFLPLPSIAAIESKDDLVQDHPLSTHQLRKKSILSNSMLSSSDEEDSESVPEGYEAGPPPVALQDRGAVLATEQKVGAFHGSRSIAMASVPSIPLSFSPYSAASTVTDTAAASSPSSQPAMRRTPIIANEQRDDEPEGPDLQSDERHTIESQQDATDRHGTSSSKVVNILKGEVLGPVAEGTVMRLVSQYDNMWYRSALSSDSHSYSNHLARTKRATTQGGGSARGSKLEPSGLVLVEGSASGCDGRFPPRAVTGAPSEGAARPTGGGADLATSSSLREFLTKSEDAVAGFDHPPAPTSIGSGDTRDKALRAPEMEQGSGFTAVLSSSTVDEDASAVANPERRKTPAADTGGPGETPANLYSISFSTVASSNRLGSPHRGPELQQRATRSSSCASSTDEASPKAFGKVESELVGPPDVSTLVDSLARSFGWIGGYTSDDDSDSDVGGAGADPPGRFAARRGTVVVTARRSTLKTPKYGAPPARTVSQPPRTSPRDRERSAKATKQGRGGRRLRGGRIPRNGPPTNPSPLAVKVSRRRPKPALSPVRGGPSSPTMSSDSEQDSFPASLRSLAAEATLALQHGQKGFLPHAN